MSLATPSFSVFDYLVAREAVDHNETPETVEKIVSMMQELDDLGIEPGDYATTFLPLPTYFIRHHGNGEYSIVQREGLPENETPASFKPIAQAKVYHAWRDQGKGCVVGAKGITGVSVNHRFVANWLAGHPKYSSGLHSLADVLKEIGGLPNVIHIELAYRGRATDDMKMPLLLAFSFAATLGIVEISEISRDDMRCSLCWNDFDEVTLGIEHIPVKTPCGHLFGKKCLVDALHCDNTRCPMCRRHLY
jgi:hypothetical protein